jgi:tetratricopeptide (TPR) repeat protein
MEPIKLLVTPGTLAGRSIDVLDVGGLFERGGQLLSAKKYVQSLAAYDKLLKHFPASRYASPSLYNAGLAHEWLGQFSKAAGRYRELIRRFGASKEAIDAAFRLGGCYAELRNWPASAEVFDTLLKRKDLSASDRIECFARKGLASFRLGDYRSARSTLQAAVDFHKSVEVTERLDTDFFLAMARYYQAAVPHVEFRNIKVDAGKTMAQNLDEKARLLLLSQAGYIHAINIRNPFWATAAGFQIGSLYREFYTTLMTVLPDFAKQAAKNAKRARTSVKNAHDQLIRVYLEEVHKAVKPLLSKAMRVFEKNVLMAETVGVRSNWVDKSRAQINELKHLLSLPPAEAAKLVTRAGVLPEDLKPDPLETDKPAGKDPAKARPGSSPSPADSEQGDDEPGRVIL